MQLYRKTQLEEAVRQGSATANHTVMREGAESSYAASVRELAFQHFASSKFAPSPEVRTFTCPGA
jgi:hypothetical protein